MLINCDSSHRVFSTPLSVLFDKIRNYNNSLIMVWVGILSIDNWYFSWNFIIGNWLVFWFDTNVLYHLVHWKDLESKEAGSNLSWRTVDCYPISKYQQISRNNVYCDALLISTVLCVPPPPSLQCFNDVLPSITHHLSTKGTFQYVPLLGSVMF